MRDRGNMAIDRYLHSLLCALVKQAGGRVTIKESEFNALTPTASIVKIWDSRRRQVVLEYAEEFTELYTAQQQQPWQTPPTSTPSSPTPSPADPTRHRVTQPMSLAEIAGLPPRQPQQRRPAPMPPAPMETMAPPQPGFPLDPDAGPEGEAQYSPEMRPGSAQHIPPTTLDEHLIRNLRVDDPNPESQSHPSRRAVLSDMSLFLKEQEQQGRLEAKRNKVQMQAQTRDGLLPFKVRKDR